MRALILHIENNLVSLSKSEQKEASKFTKRLASYSHVPTNEKEINRMQSFAKNKNLVTFVLKNLEKYPYPQKSSYPFDIISYWYCIALFIVSEDEKAKLFVVELAQTFIATNHNDLWQFRRILATVENSFFQKTKTTIEHYFVEKQDELESYQWAKQIGLGLPQDFSWMLFFEISTDGKFRTGNSLSDEEKEKRLRLTVSVYAQQGEKCWEIELKNWNNTISAWWPNLSKQKIRLSDKKNNYTLKTLPSLRNLKEVIAEIETTFKVKFDRNIYSKRFKGKIKNKNAVQKWLLFL